MTTQLIGARIKALREERKLSQDDLARLFGFKDRQTVSAIETGERRVSAEELLLAVEKLGAPLDYFTDPFLLVGEGQVLLAADGCRAAARSTPMSAAPGGWIAAFRDDRAAGRPRQRRSCAGPSDSRANSVSRTRWRRASASPPSSSSATFRRQRLAEVMERELGILVLMVDAFEGISGAACRLPELDAVLINRHEVRGPPPFRSGARALPYPHLGRDAARACRGGAERRRQSRRATRQQFRVGRADADARARPIRRLVARSPTMQLIARLNAAADELAGDGHGAEMAAGRAGPVEAGCGTHDSGRGAAQQRHATRCGRHRRRLFSRSRSWK